jgi:hypothetical protein
VTWCLCCSLESLKALLRYQRIQIEQRLEDYTGLLLVSETEECTMDPVLDTTLMTFAVDPA